MRVSTAARGLTVDPGGTARVAVDVVNTGSVIDGVSVRVIGLPPECVDAQPAMLPLFPDAGGRVNLAVALPPTYPAGRHPLTVEVVSHGAGAPPAYVDVDLDVTARPAMALGARPRLVRARRAGRFALELVNEGNVALDVSLRATDAERGCTCRLSADTVRIAAGARATVLLTVRGPRMITGSEIDRTVQVEATAVRVEGADAITGGITGGVTGADDVAAAQVALPAGEPLAGRATVQLRQRPLVGRGVLTALVLASIVGLWAAAFLLGLTKVFSGDPLTKQAPASFFAAAKPAQFAGIEAAVPAGALPKSGQLPPGVGSVISGTVLADSTRQPVGRILVQAVRLDAAGQPVVVSAAATQADGSYSLAGLFPTSYLISFTATGFDPVWYPNAPGRGGAREVATSPEGTTSGIDVVIKGKPASVSGTVNPGDTLKPVVTTVTARPLALAPGRPPRAVTVRTDGSGSYTLAGLPAPGTYEITFTAPGYTTTAITDFVNGGDQRLEPTVTLGAARGSISGVVTDGSTPLGGATVTTTVAGQPLTVTTPTVGQVGAFVLGNLPTPATYVVTFSAPGHGSQTKVVDLTGGQSRTGFDAALVSGSGSVSGRVVDASGRGLGGVTVTVGGATTPLGPPNGVPGGQVGGSAGAQSTTTLTAGSVGSFVINRLAAPGSYTLTATIDGYASSTVPVTLTANGAPATVVITLSTQLGSITGRVAGPCAVASCAGATVTASNGAQTWTTTVSAPGGALPSGGYLFTGLQPGSYSVTVSQPGLRQQTALVTVEEGRTVTRDLALGS